MHCLGGNGRGYNSFARLYGLTPLELQKSGRVRVSVSTNPAKPMPVAMPAPMPRIAHFVFGLRADAEPFHLVHYLAIASCLEVVQPDEVYVHCHHQPSGPYWDLIAPRVVVHRVEPDAHHADVVRLDVLAEHGGLYADLDMLFVGRFPERLWRAPFVIGREADVPDGAAVTRPALSDALLMSQPGSAFVEAWRAEIGEAFDGSWANHSRFLAHDLATRFPDDVHVEPQRTFHTFEPTPSGIALMSRTRQTISTVSRRSISPRICGGTRTAATQCGARGHDRRGMDPKLRLHLRQRGAPVPPGAVT